MKELHELCGRPRGSGGLCSGTPLLYLGVQDVELRERRAQAASGGRMGMAVLGERPPPAAHFGGEDALAQARAKAWRSDLGVREA